MKREPGKSRTTDRVAALVLAAGASRRFGANKLLAPLGGAPLIVRSVERVLASGIGDVRVVLGRDAAAMRQCLAHLPVCFVINRESASGMSTSLRAGVRSVPEDRAALLVALGDEPDVPVEAYKAILGAFHRTHAPIIRPVYDGGTPGHPILFTRSVFMELERNSGDHGARGVIARNPARVLEIPIAHTAPRDVDTLEDYQRRLDSADLGGGNRTSVRIPAGRASG